MADYSEDTLDGIENAKIWTALLRSLPPSEQESLRSVSTLGEFSSFCREHRIPSDPVRLWEARQSYLIYGHVPEPPQEPAEEPKEGGKEKGHKNRHRHQTLHGDEIPKDMEDLEKKAKEHANNREKEWDKTKDPTKAMDATHAWSLGKQEYYDKFAINHTDLAEEWNKKTQDPHLSTALERRALTEDARNKGNPSPDFSWRPPSSATISPGGQRRGISGFSPSRSLRQGISNRIGSGSRAGGGMMRSLFRLLLRSLISAASAAFGAVSAAVGAIAGAIAAAIAALTGISVATIIPAIVIIVVLIIIIIVVVLIAFLFPQGGAREKSPYPGITYSIVAQPEEPRRAERGQDISYKIYFLYSSAEAQTPLGSITLVSTFPPEVDFVSATGVYSQSPGSVRWVLSQNTGKSGEGGVVYTFDLVLRSDVDITITNSLSLEGVD